MLACGNIPNKDTLCLLREEPRHDGYVRTGVKPSSFFLQSRWRATDRAEPREEYMTHIDEDKCRSQKKMGWLDHDNPVQMGETMQRARHADR